MVKNLGLGFMVEFRVKVYGQIYDRIYGPYSIHTSFIRFDCIIDII